MKARVKTKIVIQATPAAVFKYLGDTQYHQLWNPSLQKVVPEQILAVGSVYTSHTTVLGVRTKAENHVTKLVTEEEIEIENKTGMLQYCVNFRVEPHDKGSRLTCTTTVASESKAFAFARPMMEHLARRELNTDLKALKQVVEDGVET